MAHQKVLEDIPNKEREYISYIDAVKSALSRRDSMQIEYEMTVDDLGKKRMEKDQVCVGIELYIVGSIVHYFIDLNS